MSVTYQWTADSHEPRQFVEKFSKRLPQIVSVIDGDAAKDDMHLIGTGKVGNFINLHLEGAGKGG